MRLRPGAARPGLRQIESSRATAITATGVWPDLSGSWRPTARASRPRRHGPRLRRPTGRRRPPGGRRPLDHVPRAPPEGADATPPRAPRSPGGGSARRPGRGRRARRRTRRSDRGRDGNAGSEEGGPSRAAAVTASPAAGAQLGEQRLALAPPEREQQEGVVVERLGHEVAHRGRVLAGSGPVRTRAAGDQVRAALGEQRHPGLGEHVLNLVRQLSGQQAGGVARLVAASDSTMAVPSFVAQRRHGDLDPVRCAPRALHLGHDQAGPDAQVDHLSLAGIGSTPGQTAAASGSTRPPRGTAWTTSSHRWPHGGCAVRDLRRPGSAWPA